MRTCRIGLNFVDTYMNSETFVEANKCWCCGQLNSVYVLFGHTVYGLFQFVYCIVTAYFEKF